MHATPGDIKSLRSSADSIADMVSVFADSTAGRRKACLKRNILSFFNINCAYLPKISRLVAKLIVILGCNARSYHVALPTFSFMPTYAVVWRLPNYGRLSFRSERNRALYKSVVPTTESYPVEAGQLFPYMMRTILIGQFLVIY